MTTFAPEVLKLLRDPRYSLPRFAKVMNQADDSEVLFDPFQITDTLQATVVGYCGDPPRTEHEQTRWLALLGPRQAGKSTTAALAMYPLTAYSPGHDHIIVADTRARADYLFSRIMYAHARWPEDVRAPSVPAREVRQLSWSPDVGGKISTLSLESGAMGIGRSPNSVHLSECAFARDMATQWTMMLPGLVNRDEVRVVAECTPAPASEPSADWWKETCFDAKHGRGRWVYAFFPYWDSRLCARPWPDTWALDNEELSLLEKYGPLGMRRENLAFRRLMLETDPELRRSPELFDVWYARDDVNCWLQVAKGVIRKDLVEKQLKRLLVPWKGPYQEYEEPEPGAQYVVGVDPTGFGARDHASFQVLKVWAGEWAQVACYADHIGDPERFTDEVIRAARRYNGALVTVEANGVGAATVALLKTKGYARIYHEDFGKPGKTTTGKSLDEMLSWLIDALLDELKLNDADTVDQMLTYNHDKRVEESVTSELARGVPNKRRRARHHWDKVSAMLMAVVGARALPRRTRLSAQPEVNVVPLFADLPYARQMAHHEQVGKDKADSRRRPYTSVRKSRR